MLSGVNPSISDEVNRQSSAIAKRREQLRRWDESETNRESSNIKLCQRVKFEQAYIFLAACSSEDRDEIDKLLEGGVDINTSNIDGLTALHQSCIDDNLYMVEYLLNKSADINCQDNEGWTPLHAAASCGNIDIVKYLLSRGAIVDVCNNEGELAIDIAEGDEIITYLENDMRRKGIDDQQSRNYEHQLMIKHAQDSLYKNKNTLKSSADSIVHLRTGATPLHVAAAKGYLDVIDLLIRAGANINSVDNDGWTPLHAAAHWDKHDVIKYLIENNADLDAKNYAGQTPIDVCDGETLELLKELKEKQPPVKNKSIGNKPSQPIIDENSANLKEKLNNLQRSLHDLSNRYSKSNQDESLLNSSNNNEQQNKQILSTLSTNSQRIFTNPLQSLTTRTFNNNESFNRENCSNIISSPTPSLDTKINRSINDTQTEMTPRRWGTTDRTVGDIPNNTGPYVRRRSGVGTNQSITSSPSTLVSVTSSLPPPTTNVTVTTTSNSIDDSKRRTNLPLNRDEEAEAQRKHRSAQARRERRSTQSVTVEDIKAAEQQIKNRANQLNELSNNQIGAPSTPSTPLTNNEHDIETERLQKVIEEKKDKIRRISEANQDMIETNVDISRRTNPRLTLPDDLTIITANDSLNLADSQQPRQRTNRLHIQRKNTGKITWNDETKEVQIRDESILKTSNEGVDEHKSSVIGPRQLISRFENNPTSKTNRSQSQQSSQKSLTITNSLSNNGINSNKDNHDSTIIKLYEDTKRKLDELNQKVDQLERDLNERDQIIEKLKTSQYIESSLDKREKRVYERKISELEEESKKIDSIKADNTRLKEENAALIRVISKLSK